MLTLETILYKNVAAFFLEKSISEIRVIQREEGVF